jgi:hypothetical protein
MKRWERSYACEGRLKFSHSVRRQVQDNKERRHDGPDLYLPEEDLLGVGTASSPRLDRVRGDKDVDVYDQNGMAMVRANGKGIWLFTDEEIQRTRFEGWAWKIQRGTPMPAKPGLNNDHPGHFMICPLTEMSVREYKNLLASLAAVCEKTMKVPLR